MPVKKALYVNFKSRIHLHSHFQRIKDTHKPFNFIPLCFDKSFQKDPSLSCTYLNIKQVSIPKRI